MRRFNLVDSQGTVRGEGVRWREPLVTYRVDAGEPKTEDASAAPDGGYPLTLANLDVRWLDDVPV